MLKHVSVSPWRGRADSVSLASSGGASSCGSGSPTPGHTPPPSRASSCASLAPLTALSSFSPADATPQQVSPQKSPLNRQSRSPHRNAPRGEKGSPSDEKSRASSPEKGRKRRRSVEKAMTRSLNESNEANSAVSVTGETVS